MRGSLLSFEGINGVGKSFLIESLLPVLDYLNLLVVPQVSQRTGTDVGARIVDVLRQSSDPFFQSGVPLTETLLLLALRVHDFETIIRPALADGRLVIEDRSIDTFAVYQAITGKGSTICGAPNQEEVVEYLYSTAIRWRPAPDATFLIIDDVATAVSQASLRSGPQYLLPASVGISEAAAALYVKHAARHHTRITVLDRRVLDTEQIVARVHDRIRQLVGQQ